MCIMNVHIRVYTNRHHHTARCNPSCLCLYFSRRTCAKFKTNIVCCRLAEPSSARAASITSARYDSRRSTLVVPAANVREIYRFHTDVCAVVQPDLPAIVASRFRTANGTLPAVEVRGAAESRQVNIEFKVHTIEN